MLQVSNVTKWFGDKCILDGVSFRVATGERVGLVGPNGCGKTTLLDIIAGEQAPDAGRVHFTAVNVRPGYLRQSLVYEPGQTLGAAILAAQGPLAKLQQHLNELASTLGQASGDRQKQLLREYARAQSDFEAQKGYELTHRMEAVLSGLRMGDVALDAPVDDLSGGQKTRLGLAAVLLREPNLLLLDEPTNHLDITGLE